MARLKEFDETATLDRAINLFWQKGYNGTSAQDLVNTLGISRSSLYDTYGDKKALFNMALNQYCRNAENGLRELIEASTNAERTIRQIFQGVVADSLQVDRPKGCSMVNTTTELAPHDEDIAALVQQNRREVEGLFTKLIKQGQDAGLFSTAQNAVAFARFLFNNYSGLRVAARWGADKKAFDDIVKVVLAALK